MGSSSAATIVCMAITTLSAATIRIGMRGPVIVVALMFPRARASVQSMALATYHSRYGATMISPASIRATAATTVLLLLSGPAITSADTLPPEQQAVSR